MFLIGMAMARRETPGPHPSAGQAAFSPAARPTLPHIVIGGLGQDDERICGAEGHPASARVRSG